MKQFLVRWLGLWLCSAGFVLLIAPLHMHHTRYVERDWVFLESSEFAAYQETDVRRLTREELSEYPQILDILRKRESLGSVVPSYVEDEPTTIRVEEWNALAERWFDGEQGARFVFEAHLYEMEVKRDHHFAHEEVKGMRTWCRRVGAVLLFLGLACFVGLHLPGRGVTVASPWVVLAGDVIYVLLSCVVMYGALDALFAHVIGTEPRFEFFLRLMGVVFSVVGIPAVAAAASVASAQRIRVTARGLVSVTFWRTISIPWDELTEVEFSSVYAAKELGAVPLLREVTKTLSLKTAWQSIAIREPALRSRKASLVGELLKHAPDTWHAVLKGKLREW